MQPFYPRPPLPMAPRSPEPSPDERKLKRRKFQKFHWFRHHNRDSDDPKWGAVAVGAGTTVAEVIATVNKLQEVANEGSPRGSLEDFEEAEWAYVLRVEREVVRRIYEALEACGWIDQDRIPVFEMRNRDQEDLSTPRVNKHREKKKAARKAAKEAAFLASTGRDVERVSTVTVTTRAEQIKADQEHSIPYKSADVFRRIQAGLAMSKVETAVAAAWIDSEGKQMVMKHLQIEASTAENRLKGWRRDLRDDALALYEIMKVTHDAGVIGVHFHNMILDQIKRWVPIQESGSPALPQAPVVF